MDTQRSLKRLFLNGLVASGMVFASIASAQTPAPAPAPAPSNNLQFPAPSPSGTLKQRVGLTDIEIVYSRPSAKKRTVFGGLVPYDAVWRTGANMSTDITFSTDVKVNGAAVPAGTYSLFTIPGKSEWTVIINKKPKQRGASEYDAKTDLVRVKAKPVALSQAVETFTIDINDIRDDGATLNLIWEKLRVPVTIQMDVVNTLKPKIDAAMSGAGANKPYYQAASFYYEHNLDIKKAREWIDAAVKQRETFYIVHMQAKILAKQGDKPAAIAAAKRSTELAIKDDSPTSGFIALNKDLIASLK